MQLLQVEVQCDCTVSYMCPALVIADNLQHSPSRHCHAEAGYQQLQVAEKVVKLINFSTSGPVVAL